MGDIPTPDAQLSALNPSSREAELWGEGGSQVATGRGVGMECPAGTVCDQRPFALSYSTRAGRAGQRLGRQLLGSRAGAAVATRGARRLRSPAGEARRPPLSCCRGGPGPQEAGAIVRPQPGTASPEATFARPELPSLAGIFAWDGGVTAVATALTATVHSIMYENILPLLIKVPEPMPAERVVDILVYV